MSPTVGGRLAIDSQEAESHASGVVPKFSIILRSRLSVQSVLRSLANDEGIEKTVAGSRLVSLQKKGYLQRVERPHPEGGYFVDSRSVHIE